MYESPIELFSVTEYAHHIDEEIESAVYEAVTKVAINVNKEELIKALQYDRHQYEKGYEDATKERKTGKWVLHQCQFDGGWDINCSVCGEGDNGFFANGREDAEYKLKHHYLMDAKRRKGMRYCNYCGAKMEVDE